MYKAQAGAQQSEPSSNGEDTASNAGAKEGDNVEDVDFEEVK
jgi:molecular chaperone DnaK